MSSLFSQRIAIAVALLIAAGCAHGSAVMPTQAGVAPQAASNQTQAVKETSILKKLKKQVVIGSTISPKLKQLNPYGLTVAPSTNGDFTAGDLVVCNFNDKGNVQGTGYTIVALHPTPGSSPRSVSEDKLLLGCDALALTPGDIIFAAAFAANDNPFLSDDGKLDSQFTG